MLNELLKSKPPFVLLPLIQKPDTLLPFLHIYGTAHPIPEPDEARLTQSKDFKPNALFDTGAEGTRMCSDVLGLNSNRERLNCAY
jgi:hypothetical protein